MKFTVSYHEANHWLIDIEAESEQQAIDMVNEQLNEAGNSQLEGSFWKNGSIDVESATPLDDDGIDCDPDAETDAVAPQAPDTCSRTKIELVKSDPIFEHNEEETNYHLTVNGKAVIVNDWHKQIDDKTAYLDYDNGTEIIKGKDDLTDEELDDVDDFISNLQHRTTMDSQLLSNTLLALGNKFSDDTGKGIVLCANCEHTLLHDRETEVMQCPKCKATQYPNEITDFLS